MKTNVQRLVDAAIAILEHAKLDEDILVDVVHSQTNVPKGILWDSLNWWKYAGTDEEGKAAERLKLYLAEV